jgi:hypothetical protein
MRNSMEVEGCGNYGERLFGNLLPRKTLYSGISGEKKVKEGMGIHTYPSSHTLFRSTLF